KVTFQDKPVKGGQVVFFDPNLGIGASAILTDDGEYRIAGPVRPGNYIVTIAEMPAPPPLPRGDKPPPRVPPPSVPKKYFDEKTTDLKVDVVPGINRFELDLKP